MDKFPDSLYLRVLAPSELTAEQDRQFYVVSGSLFRFESEKFGTIVVPVGMTTDFASIPRVVWNILSPEDPAILFASVVHDYVYSVLGKLPDRTLTRADADEVLREAMTVCGASTWQRWAIYKAVRTFGNSHWKN